MRLLTGPSCRLGAADLDGLGALGRAAAASATARARRSGGGRPARPTRSDAREHRRGARRPAARHLGRRRRASRVGRSPSSGSRGLGGGRAPAALAHRPGAGRARRRGRGRPRPRHRGAGPAGLDARRGPGPPRRLRRRRGHLRRVSADRASLGGFLAWLDAAVDEERGLDLGWIEARTDAVQVMTVHAAKGLEWDVVAVPGLVEGSFPAHSGTAHARSATTALGAPRPHRQGLARRARRRCPTTCAATRDGLPRFAWPGHTGWDDLATEAPALPRGGGRPRHRRGAPARLRRGHPGPHRPAAHRPRLGRREHARASPRASSTRCRASGLVAAPGPWVDLPPTRRPEAAEPAHRRGGQRRLADARPPRASRAPCSGRRVRVAGADGGCRRHRFAGAPPARQGRWDDEIRMLLDERARRAQRSPGRRRPAGAPVDLGAGGARRGRRAVHARPAPADADPAGAGRPARHRLPRLGRGALLAGGVRRRRRPARARPTTTPTDTDLGTLQAALPGQRVGRPHPGRGRDQRRDRRRRHRGARADRRGLRGGRARRRDRLGGRRLEDRRARQRGPGGGAGAAAVGLPAGVGPGARRARARGCGARSSTRPRARRCGPSCPGPTRSLGCWRAARPT